MTSYIEKAYEKAMDVGYEGRLYGPMSNSEWFDIEFWKALGFSLGWDRRYCKSGAGCEFSGGGEHEYGCVWEGADEWKEYMHDFVDCLIDGRKPESFFAEIMSDKKTK